MFESVGSPIEVGAASAGSGDGGVATSNNEGIDHPAAGNGGSEDEGTENEGFNLTGPADAELLSPGLVKVFYATDRQDETAIQPGDWFRMHRIAIFLLLTGLGAGFISFVVERSGLKGFCFTTSLVAIVAAVYFGYNSNIDWQRRVRKSENNDPHYSHEMRVSNGGNQLDYGICHVNIPPNHQVGELESPSIFKLEFSEHPVEHVILRRVIRSDEQTFYEDLNQCLDQTVSRSTFIFIHGFNVGFDDAVKRTAQIAHDLRFEGSPICFTWPSQGDLENYTQDRAHAVDSAVHLQKFLEDIVSRTGSNNIHLVAHSMGNQVLVDALDRMANQHSVESPPFNQIIMAAPDISNNGFRERYAEAVLDLSRHVTLYASSNDWALTISMGINGMNRAGLSGEHIMIVEGVDTIDVSEIDTSVIGHSYLHDHPNMLKDLQALVGLAPQPASARKWLVPVLLGTDQKYFRFDREAD